MSKRHVIGYSSMLLLLLICVIPLLRQTSKLQADLIEARSRLNWIETTAKRLADGDGYLYVYGMKNTDGLLATLLVVLTWK